VSTKISFSRKRYSLGPSALKSSQPYFNPHNELHSYQISRPKHLRRTHARVLEAREGIYCWDHRHFIHSLPIELLSYTFILGAEEDPHLPVSVSQVCRSWRHVALSTPALWRRVVLSPHERMWKERVRRARACTLDIELLPTALAPIRSRPLHYCPRRHLDFYSVQWLMQIALPHIQRWRSLEVVFTEQSPYLLNAALSFLADVHSPPYLREVTLIHRLNEDPQPFVLFNGFTPSLKRLAIDGLRIALFSESFINLSFLDYTHHRFNMGADAIREVLSLLHLCPKLISLRFLFPHQSTGLTSVYHKPPQPNTQISLPFLNQLHLAIDPNSPDIPYELPLLLTHLSTPVLQTVKFFDSGKRPNPFYNLKSFFWMYAIPRSLRFIHIEGGWFDPGMLDPIVKSLPRLRRVTVCRGGRGTELIAYDETQTRTRRGRRDTGTYNRSVPSQPRHYGERQRAAKLPYGVQAR
jgi:hypothetical protein